MTRLHVALVDYGVGNLHSLTKATERAGATVAPARDADALLAADAILLPGVGAFGEAAQQLAPLKNHLLKALDQGKPLLGICLGMQLLFEGSEESPGVPGLGYVRGEVKKLPHARLPQIGWNVLAAGDDPIFEGLEEGAHVYYVNSFAPAPRESVTIGTSTYGHTFTAAVRKRYAWGLQFHPEKSGAAGLKIIENFVRLAQETKQGGLPR